MCKSVMFTYLSSQHPSSTLLRKPLLLQRLSYRSTIQFNQPAAISLQHSSVDPRPRPPEVAKMARSVLQPVHNHLLAQVSRRSPQPKVNHPRHFALCKTACPFIPMSSVSSSLSVSHSHVIPTSCCLTFDQLKLRENLKGNT